jgi:hypothetical protein
MKKATFVLSVLIMCSVSSCDKHEEDFKNRDKFLGSWNVVEHESELTSVNYRSINEAYVANITRDPKLADQVSIYNFFNMGDYFKIPAYVDGNKIIVPEVELEDYDFRGSGTLSDDKESIEWTYWVDMGYGDVKYSATYTKK